MSEKRYQLPPMELITDVRGNSGNCVSKTKKKEEKKRRRQRRRRRRTKQRTSERKEGRVPVPSMVFITEVRNDSGNRVSSSPPRCRYRQ